MPKVHILSHVSVDENALQQLLNQAGCPAEGATALEPRAEASLEEFSSPEGADDQDDLEDLEVCEPEVIVAVLTPELLADDALEVALMEAANKFCRVVGVWPQGSSQSDAPSSFKKYSASQVAWDAEQIHEVVFGAQPIYKTPSGDAQKVSDTPRNTC